ncbi:hypothetical protein E3T39_05535 [Cryobacterium suzukii]|uniref:Uncharacterized protein n=1 Tax=Cryobacterium suzukii TaxID=1259198 RepID=A0A4R9AGI4_9MICO|nr:hypothetical protein E3T39_05535 [Cryobacterium suzukii]
MVLLLVRPGPSQLSGAGCPGAAAGFAASPAGRFPPYGVADTARRRRRRRRRAGGRSSTETVRPPTPRAGVAAGCRYPRWSIFRDSRHPFSGWSWPPLS